MYHEQVLLLVLMDFQQTYTEGGNFGVCCAVFRIRFLKRGSILRLFENPFLFLKKNTYVTPRLVSLLFFRYLKLYQAIEKLATATGPVIKTIGGALIGDYFKVFGYSKLILLCTGAEERFF